MTVSNLSLNKSDEYWDKIWSELDKKEQVLKPQVVSVKEEVEATIVSTFKLSLANNNNLQRHTDIPKEWYEAIVSLVNMQQPKVISNAKWSTLRQVLAYLSSQEYLLLKGVIVHDWSIADIFGCDRNAPERVFYNMGLIMLLKETDKLDNISNKVILIKNSRGGITSYSRPYFNAKNNQILIYQLL